MKALISHFQRMAAYNAGANRMLYEACAGLSHSERKKARPAFSVPSMAPSTISCWATASG